MALWLMSYLTLLILGSSSAATGIEQADTLAEFTHRSWTRADGLPSDEIRHILQTRDGYLWVATRAGLARFDGLRFTVFTRVTHPEMVDDDCNWLAEDPRGNLWIASKVLVRFDGQRFSTFSKKDGSLAPVSKVEVDKKGRIWTLSYSELCRLENGYVKKLRDGGNSLHLDENGFAWLGRQRELYVQKGQMDWARIPSPSFNPGESTAINKIDKDATGHLILSVVNSDGYGCLYQFKDGGFTQVSQVRPVGARWSFGFVKDPLGRLWLPIEGMGVDCFSEGKLTSYKIPSARNDYVTCIAADRDGNFWIGAEQTGLHCLGPRVVKTLAQQGMISRNVLAISEGQTEQVWLGTEDGLVEWSQANNLPSRTITNGFVRADIRALCVESNLVWAGSGRGLYQIANGKVTHRMLPHLNKWSIFTAVPQRAKSIRFPRIS